MRGIERTTQFKRDYKRVSKGRLGHRLDEVLLSVLELLVVNDGLPSRFRDHSLVGAWVGFRECHLAPDLLLVYELPDEETVRLVRLGSHSDLGF